MKNLLIFLLVFLPFNFAFYESDSKVIKLTASTFEPLVVNSQSVWFVEFYAPWCGHCQRLAPEWEKAAKALSGIVNFAAVDMTTDQAAGASYNIQGYPTIKFFGEDKRNPIDYAGGRSAVDIVTFVHDQLRDITDTRLKIKKEKKQQAAEKPAEPKDKPAPTDEGDEVIVLGDDNFDELVMKSDDVWFVEFYAPWCGHCKNLAPDWKKLAKKLKGQVHVAKVDATIHTKLKERFKIPGFPTLKFFGKGPKTDTSDEDYIAGRSLSELTEWVLGKVNPSLLKEEKDEVIVLGDDNFDELVMNSEDFWFVEFYAPWCGHCKNLEPEWKKLAKKLKGQVNVGKVDATVHTKLKEKFKIQGFPSLKFFGKGQKSDATEEDYNGGRSLGEMAEWVSEKVNPSPPQEGEKDVVILTDSNFEETVMKSDDIWFVEFYAPWCGHCKKLQPEWNKLALRMKEHNIKIGKLDSTQHRETSTRFNISGYPTLKLFPSGRKFDTAVEDYSFSRDADKMAEWLLEQKQQMASFSVSQLINKEVFKTYCKESKAVCLIAFLPHIYDCSKEERTAYIQTLQDLSASTRGKPITYIWAQGGDHYQLEENLGMASGYPAVVAISFKKNVYTIMRGSYSFDNLSTFVRNLISGKEVLRPFQEMPSISNVEAWDGEDRKPARESDEEFGQEEKKLKEEL